MWSREDDSKSDFHVARQWENARKVAGGNSVHFHKITDSEVVGVNNGSFNVNISKRKNRKGVQERSWIMRLIILLNKIQQVHIRNGGNQKL
ncbi:hypothetical protein Glove_117g501 [Diversispora epigaea]|uniref:Uncharacterized protein n=1 Tax=Diversispora epigaea TaxID=1348612 RepID=A0A397J2Y9_9GLOM|nr:hypothetical protein Glove_117g501 [Diversispora epigaea]